MKGEVGKREPKRKITPLADLVGGSNREIRDDPKHFS